MAKVSFYGMLIRGTEHVPSTSVVDGACALFSARLEVNGVEIRTETPEEAAWKAAGYPEGEAPTHSSQPELTIGEGFMTLYIEHANEPTWEFLSNLDDEDFTEGSTREKFGVLVTEVEYTILEPNEKAPWMRPDPSKTMERSVA